MCIRAEILWDPNKNGKGIGGFYLYAGGHRQQHSNTTQREAILIPTV